MMNDELVDELCVDVGETRDVSELDDFGETRDVSELDGDVVVVIVDVIIDGMRDCLGSAVPDDVVEEAVVVGVDEIPDETSNRRARLTNLTRFARWIWLGTCCRDVMDVMLVGVDVCRCLVAVDVMVLMMVSMKLVVDVLSVDASQRFLRAGPVSKRMGSLMRICTCPVGSQ
jgi:hypothetical protein